MASLIAQENQVARYTLGAGIGRQKLGMPLVKMLDFPSHSSFSFEVTRKYGKPTPNSWYQSIGIYSFSNTSLGSGYLFQSNIGRTISLGKTLGIFPEVGLGVTHRFLPKEVFELNDGVYSPSKDLGSIKPALNFRTLMGYNTQSIFLYVSYQLTLEFLYNLDVPVMPINYLHLGVRYSIKYLEK